MQRTAVPSAEHVGRNKADRFVPHFLHRKRPETGDRAHGLIGDDFNKQTHRQTHKTDSLSHQPASTHASLLAEVIIRSPYSTPAKKAEKTKAKREQMLVTALLPPPHPMPKRQLTDQGR